MHTSIDRRLSNDSNAPSPGRQLLLDEFSVSYAGNIYSHCGMKVTDDTVKPMGSQLVRHGLPTIDILNENAKIWSPTTSAVRRTPDTTPGSASGHVLGQVKVVVEAVGDYRE